MKPKSNIELAKLIFDFQIWDREFRFKNSNYNYNRMLRIEIYLSEILDEKVEQ